MTEKRCSICFYSTAYIIILPVYTMYCISYLDFPMWHLENFLNSLKEKHNIFLATHKNLETWGDRINIQVDIPVQKYCK